MDEVEQTTAEPKRNRSSLVRDGRRQHQLPRTALSVDGTPVDRPTVPYVRDLGIYIDSDLLVRTHVLKTASRCFTVLRQLRQIRQSVPTNTLQTL